MSDAWEMKPIASPDDIVCALRGNAEIIGHFLGWPELPELAAGAENPEQLRSSLRTFPHCSRRMDDIIMALIHHVGHGGGIQLVVKPGQKLPPVTFIELTS